MVNKISEVFESEALPNLNDIYRTALRLTFNKNDAEDIVQEVFMQAWKSIDQYEPGTNCRAWLYAILFNKYHEYRRRQFIRLRYFRETDEEIIENAYYKVPVTEQLMDKTLISALNTLPIHYRDIALLVDVHTFTYREVAETMNIPIGTVMSRLSRARKQLRNLLTGVAYDYGINLPQVETEETVLA